MRPELRCSSIPTYPLTPRFPCCSAPRKAVLTVNGKVPDSSGNVDVGDIRHDDFAGMERKESMTLREVSGKTNELIARLRGAVVVGVLSVLVPVYAELTPDTEFRDVPPDTIVSRLVSIGGGGNDPTVVRQIVDSSFTGGTGNVNHVVGTFDRVTARVSALESLTNFWNSIGRDATNYTDSATNAIRRTDGTARPLPKYLHEVSYDSTYPEDAAWYYGQYAPAGRCSARRIGGVLERNYDWNLDESAVFMVRVSASETDGRFASIGMAGVGTNLTEGVVTSGKWSRYYKCLPGHTLDGINENGVVAEINVNDMTGVEGWSETGTVHVLAAVRWALDHGTDARQAAEYLAANIKRPQGMNFHYMIADGAETWVVENGAAYPSGREKVVMTNYALYEEGAPGDGKERYAILSDADSSITNAWYTNAYRPSDTPWVSDLGGRDPQTVWATWASGTKEQHRAEGKWWQTVHTAVYDIAAKSVKVAVQETDDWYVFKVPNAGTDEAKVREIAEDVVAPVAAAVEGKADKATTYTKGETDLLLDGKVSKSGDTITGNIDIDGLFSAREVEIKNGGKIYGAERVRADGFTGNEGENEAARFPAGLVSTGPVYNPVSSQNGFTGWKPNASDPGAFPATFPNGIGAYNDNSDTPTYAMVPGGKGNQVIAFLSDIPQSAEEVDPVFTAWLNDSFADAVLAVGLNIDTNAVAVLNEIADGFGGFPIEGTATTVGGLLAALAAAVAWLRKNKFSTSDVSAGNDTFRNAVTACFDNGDTTEYPRS